jgi:hypothetical protein
MLASGHTVALSEDESRLVLLLDDNRVVELSTKAIEEVSGELLRKMGLLGFFDLIENVLESRKSV